jgi:putative two-component system response regulator
MKNNRLLIVDDEQSIINCVTRQLRNEEYEIYSASSGEAGLRLIENKNIGVVISDFNMPGMTGIDFLNRVKKIRSNIVRILFTAYASMENAINAINNVQIFRYMTKPWSQEEINRTVKQAFEYYNLAAENERMQKEIAEKNRQLQSINENLEHLVSKRTSLLEDSIREGVVMLAMAAEAKDDDTGDHLKRIALLTKEVCLAYGLSNEQSEKISFFSVMHDIGKIHIPDTILQKNGPLDPDEWEIMRTHCIAGEKILGEKPFYKTAREIARSHHERWDGTGYPDGLSENSIPLSARIVSIADVFDALTNKRKYKEAWSVEAALLEMNTLSGKAFDPELLRMFMAVIGKKG